MVAQATTSPLPQLSPEDKRLLRLYFRVGQSIQALADELISIQAIHRANPENSALGTQHSALPDEFDLATWATSDLIAPHIAYRKQEIIDARREEALKELTSLVKHSDNALERRRAASTLLRMLRGGGSPSPSSLSNADAALRRGAISIPTPPTNAPLTNNTQPNPTAPDQNSSLPLPEGGGRGVGSQPPAPPEHTITLSENAITLSTDSNQQTPLPSPHPHPPASSAASPSCSHLGPSGPSVASSSSSSSHPCPSVSYVASSPDLIPSPPSPATILRGVAGFVRSTSINPHARPHPDLSPQNLIDLSLAALKNPTDPATRAALEHFLTPQATINHEPILNLESQLVPLAPKLKVVQIFSDEDVQLSPGPPEIRTSISTLIQPGRTNRYQITLTRASPHPWLIAAIDPDTS